MRPCPALPSVRCAAALLTFLLFASPSARADEPRLTEITKLAGAENSPICLCRFDEQTILYTGKGGIIGVIKNGVAQKEPLRRLDVTTGFERGLLGIACRDGAIYVYQTYSSGFATYNRVLRLGPDKVLLDKIPAAIFHNGGVLAFGPDGMLYISTGDARAPERAQDPGPLSGKILRIAPDGAIPADNPFNGSPVWSLGHRNVFGMAFNAAGELYITENGTSRDDEVNRILKGRNYGWPAMLGQEGAPRYEVPLKTYTPNKAPTNATFIDEWFVFGAWNTGEITALKMEGGKVIAEAVLYRHPEGITDVKYFPGGYLYFAAHDGIFRAKVRTGEPAVAK